MKSRTTGWSWRTTGNPGLYTLWRDGTEVGTFSVLPGNIVHENVALDQLVEWLNEAPR